MIISRNECKSDKLNNNQDDGWFERDGIEGTWANSDHTLIKICACVMCITQTDVFMTYILKLVRI